MSVSDEERALVAALGSGSYWRVPLLHFSTWSFGFGFAPPLDASAPLIPPPGAAPATAAAPSESRELVGTTFRLVYDGERTVEFAAPRTLSVPVSGGSLAASLLGIGAEVQVAGRRETYSLGPELDQTIDFTWDGVDAYNRLLQGAQPIRVQVSYQYPASIYTADPAAFGPGGLRGVVRRGAWTR